MNPVMVSVLRRLYSIGIIVVVVIRLKRVKVINPVSAPIKRKSLVYVGIGVPSTKTRTVLSIRISAPFATPKVDRVLRSTYSLVKFVVPVRSNLGCARRTTRRIGRHSRRHSGIRVKRNFHRRHHPASCPTKTLRR